MRVEEDLNNHDAGEEKAVVRRRRRWSVAERRQIVEETLVPGASVARVAQAHGVNANQVFTWRRQYRDRVPGAAALLPVKITKPGRPAGAELAAIGERRSRSGVIHITVGKAQIHIEGEVERETLRAVLKSVLR